MADNTWRVRNLDEDTRKRIKVYAAEHDITTAEAVKRLVNIALEVTK